MPTRPFLAYRRRALRAVICLYPGPWRDRYGAEVQGLVESLGITCGGLFDLMVGAAWEQLWPTIRRPDAPGALVQRLVVSYGISWALYVAQMILVSYVFVVHWSFRSANELLTLPFLIAVLAFLMLRPVIERASRPLFATIVVATTVITSLVWLLSVHRAWGVVWSAHAPILGFLVAMFGTQAAAVFVVLNRRAIPARLERHIP